MCPVAHADGHNAPLLVDDPVPGGAGMIEDVVGGLEDRACLFSVLISLHVYENIA